MRVLLIYPLFPKSFWSFEKTLALVNRKALLPPLSLITVAAILPQEWEFKLVDRNIREIKESEWDWAELVIISGMIVQREDLLSQIKEAKKRGKTPTTVIKKISYLRYCPHIVHPYPII